MIIDDDYYEHLWILCGLNLYGTFLEELATAVSEALRQAAFQQFDDEKSFLIFH